MAEYLVKWPSGREPISKIGPSDGCGRMQFPWWWGGGMISTNLDGIWEMSVEPGKNIGAFWPAHPRNADFLYCTVRILKRLAAVERGLLERQRCMREFAFMAVDEKTSNNAMPRKAAGGGSFRLMKVALAFLILFAPQRGFAGDLTQEELLEALSDPSNVRFREAMWQLQGDYPVDPGLVPGLLTLTKNPNPKVREVAVWALVELERPEPNALIGVLEAFGDPEPKVAFIAVFAFERYIERGGTLGDLDIAPALAVLFEQPAPYLRGFATGIAAEFAPGDPRLFEHIVPVLAINEERFPGGAARALVHYGARAGPYLKDIRMAYYRAHNYELATELYESYLDIVDNVAEAGATAHLEEIRLFRNELRHDLDAARVDRAISRLESATK